MKVREYLLRGVQAFLGLEVLWHLGEVVLAIRDEAWLTSVALSIHATVVIVAVYFIGHDHTHHGEDE